RRGLRGGLSTRQRRDRARRLLGPLEAAADLAHRARPDRAAPRRLRIGRARPVRRPRAVVPARLPVDRAPPFARPHLVRLGVPAPVGAGRHLLRRPRGLRRSLRLVPQTLARPPFRAQDMTMPNDSHHDQVMRLRIAGEGLLPRRYFGYGTILDRDAFDEWRM